MIPAHERVLARVAKDPAGCWLFEGGLNKFGYGKVSIRKEGGAGWAVRGAHRVVYEALVGPVPPGLQLDHLCRQRRCVNPDHLEPVTPRENTMRSRAPSRLNADKTACDKGHELTPENTYTWRGQRHCRACRRESDRQRQATKTEYMREWRARNRPHVNEYARQRRAQGRRSG